MVIALCHEHCFFICCVLCTAAWLYCEHCFIDIWYAVAIFCCMFYAIGTATLYQGHCYLIHCMLCTASSFVPWVLLLHILYAMYCRMLCVIHNTPLFNNNLERRGHTHTYAHTHTCTHTYKHTHTYIHQLPTQKQFQETRRALAYG